MQAKIIDFASDKLVNALHKIDKNDVKKVMTNISAKAQGKNSQAPPNPSLSRVTSSEEYCAMLKNEFVFLGPTIDEGTKGILKQKSIETKLSIEDSAVDGALKNNKFDENDRSNQDATSIMQENSIDLSKTDASKQYQNEVQSFVQKKNIAQGMMDLALLSSNCNQLRYVLDMNTMHPYYLVSLILIGTSLALQVIVGLGLLYSNGYNLKRRSHMRSANRFSNLGIIGVFFITIINVLIATFNGTNLPVIPPPAIKPMNDSTLTTVSEIPLMVQDDAVV